MANPPSRIARLLNRQWQLTIPQLIGSMVVIVVIVASATTLSLRRWQQSPPTPPLVLRDPYSINKDLLLGDVLLASNGKISLGNWAQEELSKLMAGKIAHNIPTEMAVGEKRLITIRIARQIIEDFNAKQTSSDEPVKIASLKIGSLMSTHVVSDEAAAFDINRRFPVSEAPSFVDNPKEFGEFVSSGQSQGAQLVSGDEPTEWLWEIKAKESGSHNVRLIATVELISPGFGYTPQNFLVYEQPVKVRRDPFYGVKHFLSSNWQFVLNTILGSGLIGVSLAYLKNRWSRTPRQRSNNRKRKRAARQKLSED